MTRNFTANAKDVFEDKFILQLQNVPLITHFKQQLLKEMFAYFMCVLKINIGQYIHN